MIMTNYKLMKDWLLKENNIDQKLILTNQGHIGFKNLVVDFQPHYVRNIFSSIIESYVEQDWRILFFVQPLCRFFRKFSIFVLHQIPVQSKKMSLTCPEV